MENVTNNENYAGNENRANQTSTNKMVIQTENGSSGLLAVIISFFFGPFGAFFCWWMMAKWGFWKSIGIATVFLVLDIVSVLLFAVFISFILLPIVYIVMLIVAYKACSKGVMEIETTQTIS